MNLNRYLLAAGKSGVRVPVCLLCIFMMIISAAILSMGVAAYRKAKLTAPEPTVLLLDREGRFLARIEKEKGRGHGYWPVDPLPERVAAATIALEDRRFHRHPGVDPVSVARAVWQNMANGRRISGASTIAMQVARLQSPGPRTYRRKALEAATALLLTLRYGRAEILSHYLRLVPYGRQIHGIAYASQFYLDKPAKDLSWAEIAYLTAIPHAPGRMTPGTRRGDLRAKLRGRRILSELLETGVVSSLEYTLATRQLSHLTIRQRKVRPPSALHAILRIEKMLERSAPAGNRFLVRSSLDLDLQEAVSRMASRTLDALRKDGACEMAAMVIRKQTCEVMASLGSSDYFSPRGGAIDYTGVKRAAGSTLKPFIYALGLANGTITAASVLDDIPEAAPAISNADMRFLGPMMPRQALGNSRNIPAVGLTKKIGIDEVHQFLAALDLHDNRLPARHYGLGMALGALPVTLSDLVSAYGVLAGDGCLVPLKWFKNRKDPVSGPTLKGRFSPAGHRLLPENVARQITLFLSDPMARLPSFPRMGALEFPFPVAVKTGTSKGYRDGWTIAWSGEYLVGVWTGRSDSRPMKALGGASSAALLVREILLFLHRGMDSGMADRAFANPEGGGFVSLCAVSGGRNTGRCDRAFMEWFAKGMAPEAETVHREADIDIRNGLLATPWTPYPMRKKNRFLDLPARLAHWSQAKGIPEPPSAASPIDLPSGVNWPGTGRNRTPLAGNVPVRVTVTSPQHHQRVMRNPGIPEELNTLCLFATAVPEVPQVVWYVDGKPFRVSAAGEPVRWPLVPGTHSFQARLPYRSEVSNKISIIVE